MSFAPENETIAKPEALLRVPMGLASPLWGLFAGAAMTGAAWWWMTRWARPENLEAMFGAAAKVEAEIESEVVALTAPAIEAVVEAAPSAMAEFVTEVTAAPVLAAMLDEPAEHVVGGESAPFSPMLETMEPELTGPEPELEPEPEPEPLVAAAPEPPPAAPKPRKTVAPKAN